MVSDVDALRAHWDERYTRWPDAFAGDPSPELVELAPNLSPGCRCLVLADGRGRESLWLAARGHVVTGVELSAVATQLARGDAAAAGLDVELVTGDAVAWCASGAAAGPWDLVVSTFGTLGPGSDTAVALALAPRLAPGAQVLVTGSLRTSSPERVTADWPTLAWESRTDGERFSAVGTSRPRP